MQIPDTFSYSQLNKEQILNLFQEEEPHIAGFKNEINKHYFEISTKKNVKLLPRRRNAFDFMKLTRASTPSFKNEKVSRDKHNEPNHDNIPENYRKFNLLQNSNSQEEESPFLRISIEEINKYINLSTTMEDTMEPTDEDDYDYDAFKMEYEQQFKKDKKLSDKLHYTHTEKQMTEEQIIKKPIEKVTDTTESCTKKDMDYFGFKAIKCLIYNYQHVKDTTEAKRTLSKMWLMVKVWLCIYVCIAIPCWCQRGRWCCWWLRCKMFFPRKRIIFVKQYYMRNPPGILIPKLSKKKPIKYEPSEYEQDMYEKLEAAIRNI
ncbi:hypothetical protein HZH68_016678 [Vespula germanica]|uniref:Uncharacterized protein n=1 Tax=Vespula germanica TaxID=30212 RepID=A0A834MP17_VESGE|nr:hypothetical protein HZH68_016678 [Vespula germanica]